MAGVTRRGAMVARWFVGLPALGLATAVVGANAAAVGGGWGAATALAPLSEQTFAQKLAVSGAGRVVAAWFAGPGPPISFGGPIPRVRKWTGTEVVADIGTVRHGFGPAVALAGNGDDLADDLKLAVSGSGEAFVLWHPVSGRSWWMIAAARDGRFGKPRPLGLGRYVYLRFAFGLDGPVDVFWYRLNSGVTGWSCTRLRADGTLGQTLPVAHPFKPNPCRLPASAGMSGRVPPSHPTAPSGWQAFMPVVRNDGQGDWVAIWDDIPASGGNTQGMFTAVHRG
jgi:hypothetical protein